MIDAIWEELEGDKTLETGLLYKRYSASVKPNFHVALKAPENLRCIAIHLKKDTPVDIPHNNVFKDIRIELYPDHYNLGKKFLLILLLNSDHHDIFSTLCVDLIMENREISDEIELVEQLFIRLNKWHNLFAQLESQGLSDESQRGLFGELKFLEKYIEVSTNLIQCITAWKGPENAIQDYQSASWALEVKTTHGKNHQKIQIANERQLDTDIFPIIYLFHLSLDVREKNGETLNEIVDKIMSSVSKDYSALNAFKLKLLSAGYYEVHRPVYAETGYLIRQQRVFQVMNDFPRITESQISGGIGDVRYSIVLSDEVPWKITEQELFKNLLNNV